jgi:hypothetical protein
MHSQWNRAAFALLAATALSCGDDGRSPANEDDAAGEDDAATEGTRRDASAEAGSLTDARRPMSDKDGGADAGKTGRPTDASSPGTVGVDASPSLPPDSSVGRVDPAMVTSGPTEVSGSSESSMGLVQFVDGLAYYDPTSSESSGIPALKLVFTTWKLDSCDPQAIHDREAEEPRVYAYCSAPTLESQGSRPATLNIHRATNWEIWRFDSVLGCTIALTQGEMKGGKQVIGKMGISALEGGPELYEVNFSINHCGTVNTDGNI